MGVKGACSSWARSLWRGYIGLGMCKNPEESWGHSLEGARQNMMGKEVEVHLASGS